MGGKYRNLLEIVLRGDLRLVSRNGTLWNVSRSCGSLRLDVGRPDHFAPLLGDQMSASALFADSSRTLPQDREVPAADRVATRG